jgi:hypothetical protein
MRDSQYISPKVAIKRGSFINFHEQPFNTLVTDSHYMFESQGRTRTTHKQIVIATIAVSAMLLLYAVPTQNQAIATDFEPDVENEPEFGDQDLAQDLVDRTRQDIDQDARQSQEQDQEVEAENELEQSNEAEVSQDEENNQANVIDTGDNSATTTATAANDADNNALAAESEGGDAEAETIVKKTKDKVWGGSATGGSSEAEASIEQEAEATATTVQDSSADDNTQTNVNTFGDDVAVVDQDNTATQTATAVGLQTADQDLNQYATNVDLTAQLGENLQEASLESIIDCSLIDEDRQGGGGADVCSP